MSTHFFSQILSRSSRGLRRRIGIVLALTSLGMTACATTDGIYNPDHLRDDQAGQIAYICQSTLGLNPKESPVLGDYRGTPHLDSQVSHYQACIASLSDSVQKVADAAIAAQADQECRGRGLGSGSPALAECVLDQLRVDRQSKTSSASPVMKIGATYGTQPPIGSFFYASGRETRRREERACAQLGLEPPNGHFAECVKLLEDNFFAIDNPVT